MNAPPVITGLGVVAPNGLGTEEYWSAVLAGESGIRRITRFDPSPYPVQLAGEIREFSATDHIPSRLIPQTDTWTHLGLFAAELALSDAAVDPAAIPEYDMAVMTASSAAGVEFGQREIESLWSKGPRFVGPYQSIAWFYAATTGQISIRNGMRGPCGVIVTEQAGGLDALAQVRRVLRSAQARIAVTGGTEAPLCPYSLTCQIPNGRLSRSSDPARAFLPFDVEASGGVPGEGGAILIVEDAEHARDRKAPQRYAEVVGYAATFDPSPSSGRPPSLRRAVEGALDDAGITPDEVDVVFADAAGVPDLDRQEAEVIAAIFGPGGVPVTAPKTMTGRLYAGGGALDVATAALSLHDSVIPPTVGVTELAPACGLDLVGHEPREMRLRHALVVGRGYGGFNSSLVLRKAA